MILDTFRLLHTIFPYNKWLASWITLYRSLKILPDTKITLVQWIKPHYRWVKLNTYGGALNNSGRIGARGIIRNTLGNLIFAYKVPLGEATNNQAKVKDAIFVIA